MGFDGTVRTWETQTGKEIEKIRQPAGSIFSLSLDTKVMGVVNYEPYRGLSTSPQT